MVAIMTLFDQSTDPDSYRRRLAAALMTQGMDTSPVGHWTQGAARMANALVGGLMQRQLDTEQKGKRAELTKALFGDVLDNGTTPQAAAPMPQQTVSLGPAAISAAGETGRPDFSRQGQVANDTGGSKSYGVFGLNTWAKGGDPNNTSMGRFIKEYGPSLGLTAPIGSPDLDAQWKSVAQTNPQGLQVAQMDWHRKNIGGQVADKLTALGVPPAVAADPRVAAYFSDRMVQQGPNSLGPRVAQAWASAGGDPAAFMRNMSAADRENIGGDFRTYLAGNPNNVPGLNNRITKREQMAMGMGGSAGSDTLSGGDTRDTLQPQGGAQPMRQQMGIPAGEADRIRKLIAIGSPEAMQAAWLIRQQYLKPQEPKSLTQVDQGTRKTLVNPLTGEPVREFPVDIEGEVTARKRAERQATDAMPGTSDDAAKLRGEIRQLSGYKSMATVVPRYNAMAKAKDDRAGDLTMVYGFMKLLDPESVVRESEVSMAQNIATIPENFRAQVQSFLTGKGRLAADVRAAIMGEATTAAEEYRQLYEQQIQQYRDIVQSLKLQEGHVIPQFAPFAQPTQPTQPTAPTLDALEAEKRRRMEAGR